MALYFGVLMELQDFIKTALNEIVSGVAEAIILRRGNLLQ